MNERIRQLMEEAGIELPNNVVDGVNGPGVVSEKDKLAKFAELIARECAEIALEQKKWVEDQKVYNPEDKSWNKARIQQSQHIVDKIKLHFGVEE
jgi:hypothetical protein